MCMCAFCAAGLTVERDSRLQYSLGMEPGEQGWSSLLVAPEARARRCHLFTAPSSVSPRLSLIARAHHSSH